MIAVAIRPAPGEPMASTEPSVWRPTVGAMLESRRVPGARPCRPWALSSCSPRRVVEPDPGARRHHPGEVARQTVTAQAHAVGVGGGAVAVEPDSSSEDVAVDEVEEARASPSRSRLASRALRWPRTAALDADQQVDVIVGPCPATGRPSRSRSIAATQTPPTEGGGVVARFQSPTRVASEGRVTGSYAARSSGPRSPPRSRTSAEMSRASSPVCIAGGALGRRSARASRRGRGTTIRSGGDLALVVMDRGPAGVVPAEDRVVDVVEVVARCGAQPEARRARRSIAGATTSRHGSRPSRRCASLERRDRAVRRDRAGADGDVRRRRRTPVWTSQRAVGRAEGARSRPGMSIQPSTVYGAPAPRRLDGDEPTRAQRDDPDLVDHRDQDRGERCVDRVAAGAHDLFAGVGRGLVGRGDRDVRHQGTVAPEAGQPACEVGPRVTTAMSSLALPFWCARAARTTESVMVWTSHAALAISCRSRTSP